MLETNPFIQTQSLNRSSKYVQLETAEVHEVFQDNGFRVTDSGASSSKKRAGYQPHWSTWTRDDLLLTDNEYVNLLFRNSHDGSTSASIDLGVFRLICSNGLYAGSKDFSKRIRHAGDAANQLNDAIRYVVERAPQIAAQVNLLKEHTLSPSQLAGLVNTALIIRGVDSRQIAQFKIPQPTRRYDVEPDAWTQMNVIQECIVRGGLEYELAKKTDEGTVLKWNRTRKLSNTARIVDCNKQLWEATQLVIGA